MRVIKFLFSSLIVLGTISLLTFLVVREVLLQLAVSQVRTGVSTMRRVATQSGSYLNECRKKGVTPVDGQIISSIQLRFTSDREYVVEVICNQYSLDPVRVNEFMLPPLVTKQIGRSGIVWGEALSGITLELWGRTRGVYVEDYSTRAGVIVEAENVVGPISSCEGYGFTCCANESSQGVGPVYSQANDCPRSCYSSCEARPVVLSLNTQPFYDQKTRIVQVKSGEAVEINYVADIQGAQSASVVLDFGDGEEETFTTNAGNTSHLYECSQANCEYIIKVKVENEQGVESVLTPISQVKVIVTP